MSLNQWQAADVAKILAAIDPLIDADEPYGIASFDWGDGFRAQARFVDIPVYSDATGVDELLGYIRQNDEHFYFEEKKDV